MSPADMAGWAATAERAGFESVWVTEAFWDAIVPLSLMSRTTERVRLGTACAIVGRHPHPAQMAWVGIDDVSDGRLVLGLADGPSGPNSSWWGTRTVAPARRMREHIELLRLMFSAHSGRTIDYEGNEYLVHGFQRWVKPRRERIPILVGATQPSMLRLAGELADGYVAAALNAPAHFREVVWPSIEHGMAHAGRSRRDLEVASVRICSVAERRDHARQMAKTTIAFYAGIAPRLAEVLDHCGYATERAAVEAAFLAGDITRAASRVPEGAVDAVAIAGTPDEARTQLAEFGADFDTVILYPPTFGLEKGQIEENHRAIVETFAPDPVMATAT
jgi:alkanesulfonate monooxygenase SsuD/methylene tetrahydromethanopterin reductase-like flavin-dependent oxidoreductase (luciferase family)